MVLQGRWRAADGRLLETGQGLWWSSARPEPLVAQSEDHGHPDGEHILKVRLGRGEGMEQADFSSPAPCIERHPGPQVACPPFRARSLPARACSQLGRGPSYRRVSGSLSCCCSLLQGAPLVPHEVEAHQRFTQDAD